MNRYEKIKQIYDDVVEHVISSKHEWQKFLLFSSILYKYKFEDALLIYAQKPNATIVADMKIWNKIGRYVNKRAKAIAVYDDSYPYLKLKNLFDISDTNGNPSSIPKMWEIDELYKTKLLQNLNLSYNLYCISIESCIKQMITLKIEEAYDSFMNGFESDLIGTSLEKFPLQSVKMYFKQTIIESAEVVINNRSRVNSIQENSKFAVVSHFNTKKLVFRMGNAINNISQDILREIERNVKQIQKENSIIQNTNNNIIVNINENKRRVEYERYSEQYGIRGNGRNILSENTNIEQQRSGRNASGEIWTDGTELHEGESSGPIQLSMFRGGINVDDAQSERRSLRTTGHDSGATIENSPDTKPDEHYGNHSSQEQANDDSGGNRTVRNSLQKQITPNLDTNINSNNNELPLNGSSFFVPENEVFKSDGVKENTHISIPLGEKIKINNRDFIIDSINEKLNKVELRDVSFLSNVGFPIFRTESIDFIKSLLQNNQIENQVSDVSQQHYYNHKSVNINNITNYRYDEADEIGIGGIKAKFRNNIEAIKTLKAIESENRLANPHEQKILARYVGFGGMAQVFDKTNGNWKKEYYELKILLNESEYTSARASTPNAHYTSSTVIKSIYKALDRFGFLHGNILEPAMGVGNFFSLLPEHMNESKLYGVELDDITGRIAKQIYPNANIQIKGFEETHFQDNFFDIAIGNVPFGDYKVFDSKYNKYNLNIHDYFFIKALDKVKPNGIVAFITSKGTLDKQNNSVRKLISEKADLIGAIRLPNTAFKSNANTDVTTDIIFLQKRERILYQQPNWIDIGFNDDGIPINNYYIENPHMMLGKMIFSQNMYGNEKQTALIPFDDSEMTGKDGTTSDLSEQLDTAIKSLNAMIMPYEVTDNKIAENYFTDEYDINNSDYDINDPNISSKSHTIPDVISADPNIKNFTFTALSDNNQNDIIYYRENNIMRKINVKQTTFERIIGLHEIRQITRNIIDIQMNGCTEYELKSAQTVLNQKYDEFVSKYGYITSKSNNIAFRDDSDYPLLCSLECVDEYKNVIKADMFSKRTIRPKVVIERADNTTDALYICLNEKGKIDINFIAKLSDKEPIDVITELKGLIYKNPEKSTDINDFKGYETADEYLSGNVRYKLKIAQAHAQEQPELFNENVTALSNVQPKDLEAGEIDVRLGATWIEPQTIEQFIYELLNTPRYNQNIYGRNDTINVHYNNYDCSWHIQNKLLESASISACESYGTKRISAYHIIEDTLNLKDVVVKDKTITPDGNERYVINKKETMIARAKQEQIKDEFKNWIFKEPERRKKYVDYYNQTFNNIRLREYNGSFLTFGNMNPDIKLRKHQVDAIARIILSGTALLAHTVGAGKSFEMIAAAMELKRIGLSNKSIIVVPNHITEQMGAEFLRLYPTANILIATKKDFEKNNRKRFISKIATGTYDAIIIGHTQFEKIPISKERQEKLIKKQIKQISEGIKEAKQQKGDKWNVKQMEKYKKNLLADLKKLADESRKDDLINFEQLGIDYMFVDEAHSYKNCAIYSKMRNVAGITNARAKKSTDMLLKCQYIQEKNNGRGVVFATGTPLSNSLSEMYVMQRYLQNDELEKRGIKHFDAWSSMYGEVVSSLELAPEGNGYRIRSRFSKFNNLPELMSMFKNVADIQTSDMLNLPVPKLKTDKYIIEASNPIQFVERQIESFAERAEKIRNGSVKPNIDNMLRITNEARLLGTDPRLINPNAYDDPNSKLNICIRNVFQIYTESENIKGTQIIFCDVGTPNADGRFSVYTDIKNKLIKLGVPEDEICFIHDAKNETDREAMFSDLRTGNKRIIVGSTAKMGVGTNIQTRLIALHHVDCPYRPADIQQREGRILRQGNKNEEVSIFRYVTKNTFDSYLWGIVEQKQRFISQIMTSKSIARSAEDIDETVLSFAEVKAIATGNPLIKEKMTIDNDVARLKILKSAYNNQRFTLQDNFMITYPNRISKQENLIKQLENDIKTRNTNQTDDFKMIIQNKIYADKEKAGEIIKILCQDISKHGEPKHIGEFNGFELLMRCNMSLKRYELILKGNANYTVEIGESPIGNITRLENTLKSLESRIESSNNQIEEYKIQMLQSKAEYEKPFIYEEQLNSKLIRQSELNVLLDMDKSKNDVVIEDDAENTESEQSFNTALEFEDAEIES